MINKSIVIGSGPLPGAGPLPPVGSIDPTLVRNTFQAAATTQLDAKFIKIVIDSNSIPVALIRSPYAQ